MNDPNGPAIAPSKTSGVSDLLRATQLRQLYGVLPAGIVVQGILAALLVAIEQPAVGWPAVLWWLGTLAAVWAWRMWTVLQRRRATPTQQNDQRWLSRFRVGAFLNGIAWGLGSYLLFVPDDPARQIVLVLVVAILCSGAATALAVDAYALVLLAFSALLPLEARLVLTGSSESIAIAGVIFVAIVIGTLNSRSIRRDVRENIELRLDAEDRRRAAEESEARFGAMADGAPSLIWVADVNNLGTWFNRRWLEYTGRTMADELGTGWAEGVHPDDLAHATAECSNAFDARRRFEIEFRLRRADGSYGWVADTGIPRFNSDGTFEGYIGYCWDISVRKEAESVLAAARDSAQAADQAKSKLLATISHELRTPLNAIVGFAQLLTTNPSAQEAQANYGREITQASAHLLTLVDDLVDLARIEAGRLDLDLKSVAAGTIVANAAAMVEPLARKRDITIETAMPDAASRDMWVYADPTRLQQVLINLLTNACKYNRRGGMARISWLRGESMGRIVVKDNGTGIATTKQDGLLNPTDQALGERSTSDGMGIGLVISRRLVDAMGGVIGFKSTEGEGSEFWVDLPLATTRQQELELGTKLERAPAPVVAGQRPMVLYIEDNAMNVRLMVQVFESRPNIELRCVDRAEDGIELARSTPPALILMDINLRGMDGYSALALLRQDPRLAHIPVVAVSSNAMKGDAERGLAAGFVAYVTKPIDLKRLFALIDTYVAPESPNVH